MRRVPASAPRVARAVALAAAAAALVLTAGGPDALRGPLALVVAAAALVPVLEWARVPAPLARVLPRVTALALVATALVAWLSRSLGTLVLDPALFPRVAGPVLLAAALAFTLAPRAFPVGRAQAPAIIGVLCVAGLDPSPDGYPPSALPFLRAGEHSAFAERYLGLALVVLVALWTGALLESGPRWRRRTVVTMGLSLLAAAAVATSGIVGLPLLQPHVERAVAAAFVEGTTGLSNDSRLGEFARLAVSRRRVLDLQTSLPAPGRWLLPAQVMTRFDGHGWKPAARSARAAGTPPPSRTLQPQAPPSAVSPLLDGLGRWFEAAPPPAGPVVALRVTQAEVTSWPLLLPRGVRAVTAASWVLTVDEDGLLRRPGGDALRLYGAVWSHEQRPAAGITATSPAETADALALPSRVDPRLAALARALGRAPTPRARADAVVAHLQGGYRYTLAPGAFRTDDPLAEFLFEKKAAYCEYFATAAAILLRLQGVPARFVKGLSLGPHTDQGGGLHVVRESAAHAWVEAWLDGEGWVALDPTPPADFAATHPEASAVWQLLERVRAALATGWARLVALGPTALVRSLARELGRVVQEAVRSPVAWLAVVAAAGGRQLWRVVSARRRRGPRPKPEPTDARVPANLRALVRELERRWARAGRERPLTRGLLEHARRVSAGLAIVEAYYRARYGGEVPSEPELQALRASLDRPGR